MAFERLTAALARTPVVALMYGALAVVATWPVARYLGTRLAGDVHDPAFNSWVLAWTTGQILKALGGDLSAITNFWNANIFYPEPLTLAYSEHLFGQALQVLPVQALTGNILLSYNLLFISTFALSGFSVYMLVRDLTGRPLAAFVAGLAFAYAPYRLSQLSHLQVLSSYWMPLALVGFRRYFVRAVAGEPRTPARRALAGGAVAVAMQNLSCGYYMLFFAPFAAAYCLYEVARRRLFGRWIVWAELAIAAILVALITWPFARAYFELREVADMGVRSLRNVVQFSADTYAFATPPRRMPLLSSWLHGDAKPEGAGFPGFTILALAAIGLAWGLRRFVADLGWSDAQGLARHRHRARGGHGCWISGPLGLVLCERIPEGHDRRPHARIQRCLTRGRGVSRLACRDGAGCRHGWPRRDDAMRIQRSATSRSRP